MVALLKVHVFDESECTFLLIFFNIRNGMYASATSYVFDVVLSLDSLSASSLPGTLLWPGTQLRETGVIICHIV